MFLFRFLARFGAAADGWSMTTVLLPLTLGGRDLLLAGSSAFGRYTVLDHGGAVATPLFSQTLAAPLGAFALEDAALVTGAEGPRLYSTSRADGQIDVQAIGTTGNATGRLSALAPLQSVGGVTMAATSVETLMLNGVAHLAVASAKKATLDLIRLPDSGLPQLVTHLEDTPKATLDGISDMVSFTLGGQSFLAVASGREDGLSLFQVGAEGSLTLTDALTPKDGLWIDGLDVLATASLGGIRYLIAGSVSANSLSVIRVNDLGVMFVTDQMWDDATTRFGAPDQIAVAAIGNRSLILAAGGDGGISLLELMPDGRLIHHTSLEARDGTAVLADGVTGLAAWLDGSRLEIFAAGNDGLVQMEMSLANFGPLLQGTSGNDALSGGSADELIFGGTGRDTLSGGAGDDILVALSAGATLRGGAGADLFRPGVGSAATLIADFERGADRIDLNDWGRVYDISALTIRATATGAEISFGDNLLQISQPGGGAIAPTLWTADDFLF